MKVSDNLHAFLWVNPTTNNCNTYFIRGEKDVLVDPGHDHLFGHVEDNLSALFLSAEDIDIVIITHCHPDHMEGIKAFVGTPTLIAVPRIEMDFIREVAPRYQESLGISDFEPEILLQEGDLTIGGLTLQVILTPGHSPGSICLYWPEKKALFSGDVIFNQGVGRTDLPGGNGEELKESIRRLSRLEANYLLPGHGDILSGSQRVKANFEDIERLWFAYL